MLIFLLISTAVALPCSPGTYSTDPTLPCQNCSAGFYQDSSEASKCKGCFPGLYQNQVAQADCKVCPLGYFQNMNSQENCQICSVGTYASTTGLSSCEKCPSGTYSTEIGAQDINVCQDCPVNTYETPARSHCELCEIGFTSQSRASNCTECPSSGSCCDGYGLEDGECQQCLAGNFSNNGTCEVCPSGYVSTINQSNPTTYEPFFLYAIDGANECQQCEVGFSPFENRCRACPVGQYEKNRLCIDCEAGKYRSNESDLACSSCPAGFFSEGQIECEPCDYNMYSDTDGSTNCSECAPSHFSPKGAAECKENCDAFDNVFNDTTKCTYCLPGKFSTNSSITNASQCQSCPIGYIRPYEYGNICIPCQDSVSSEDRTTCNDCPLGQQYNNLSCHHCSAGTFRDNTSDICQNCSAGLYQTETGQTSCKECDIGRFSDYASVLCTDCPEGYVSNVSGTGGCLQCPNGKGSKNSTTECSNCTFGEETLNGRCILCPAGKEATSKGVCSTCPYGKVSQSQNASCVECSSATYAKNASFCGTCDGPNSYTNKIGAGSTHCIECLPNASTLCQTCEDGKYNENGACEQCPAGWVNKGQRYCQECSYISVPNLAATECEICPSGQEKVNVSCSNCAIGKFGQSGVCYECLLGKYQPQAGKISCIDCDTSELKTTQNKGSATANDCVTCESLSYLSTTVVLQGTCSVCQSGKYVSEQKDSCQNCPSGYYRSTTETTCSICPIGQFSELDEHGTSPCANCVSGKYTTEEGQSSCKNCDDTSGHLCDDCSAGKKQVGSTCIDCQPGKFSVTAQTICQTCSTGFYQDEHAGTFCKGCQYGEYQNEESQLTCKKCPFGYFQPIDRQGACHKCVTGQYANEEGLQNCKSCPSGHYTDSIGSTSSVECKACPKGYFEFQGSCSSCQESNYQDVEAQTNCKSCPQGEISSIASTNVSDCFSIVGIRSYVFGMKSDAKPIQLHTKKCEIRPNLMLLCPGCSCDSDSRNGFWDGPLCDECQRGFATRTCSIGCPAYDGTHDSTMCNGNGKCWFGKYGNGLCYCGGLSILDATAENAVVDVRLCPKGNICPNYDDEEQEETSYRPIYYVMLYREYSVFVLQLNSYTPESGHMWFKRYARNKAYENTCVTCISAFEDTVQTKIGYWSKEQKWKYFKDSLQVENGFHGENCQHECGLCMNGGKCHTVPHPYRYTYTIKDTFQPQKSVSIPTTTCVCSSISFDSSNMCCPNGFQPYIYYGVRGSEPYTRFTRTPFVTSLVNTQRDYWVNKDIYLEPEFTIPYAEPDSGEITVMQQDKAVVQPFEDTGPYNKHVFYGVPRDICRACPGLFGMGVQSQGQLITTENKAEEFWWDNAMGAMSRKCNGIGVCDFYKREREQYVHFMGNAQAYNLVTQNKVCNTPTVYQVDIDTIENCATFASGHNYFSFSNTYRGGTESDFSNKTYESEMIIRTTTNSIGYGYYLNGTEKVWVVLNSTDFPMPDQNSKYTITAMEKKCAAFNTCESYSIYPGLSTYKMEKGRGDSRLSTATFNRFDTCFTFTYQDKISVFGLYVTKDYIQGQDPFLGGLCPKGYFCTMHDNIGYKEACPPGYYQEYQGVTRTIASVQCSKQNSDIFGCKTVDSSVQVDDYVDLVCKRCSRNAWSAAGSAACTECPRGRVKKIAGNVDKRITMLNFPTSLSDNQIWYYHENENGYQETDCALVPEAIIHIPDMNKHMSYDIPSFLSVVSCPYGYSSRAGSYIYVENTDLITAMESKMHSGKKIESIIEAPYIKLKKTYDWIQSTLVCANSEKNTNIVNYDDCKVAALQTANITNVKQRNNGIKGCYMLPSVSMDVAFFSTGAKETLCSPNVQYFCQQGINNDQLWRNFVVSNCFRCPGNSISGPESGACVTCYANQMKWYAKIALQQGAEDNMQTFVEITNDATVSMPTNAPIIIHNLQNIQNIVLSRKKTFVDFQGAILRPNEDTLEVTEVDLNNCYLQCQFKYNASDLKGIGVRQKHPSPSNNYDGPLCYCATAGMEGPSDNSNSDGTIWYQKSDAPIKDWSSDAMPLCFACQPGNRKEGGQCKACDVGYFTSTSLEANRPFCNPCQPGTYQHEPGQSRCFQCPEGYHQKQLNQASCNGCAIGKYQPDAGTSECKDCDSGQYQDDTGKTLCTECQTGRYITEMGTNDCKDCVRGQYQNEKGKKTCKDCDEGTSSDDVGRQGVCTPCEPGKIQSGKGQTSCTPCSKGEYMDEQGSSSKCKSCDKGPDEQSYSTADGATSCIKCPGGQTCQRTTGISLTCEAGEYLAAGTYATKCKKCDENKGSNPDKTECVSCGTNQYARKGSGLGCQNCPAQGFNGWSKGAGFTYYWGGCSSSCSGGVKAQFSAHWVAKKTGLRKLWGRYTDDSLVVNVRPNDGPSSTLNLVLGDQSSGYTIFHLKAGDSGTMDATCTNVKGPYQCYFGIINVDGPTGKEFAGNGMHFFRTAPPSTNC